MRKLHRSLAVIAAAFLLWIASTGVAMQLVELTDNHPSPARAGSPAAAPAPAAAGPVASPRRTPRQELHHTLQHLHSGEAFGPVGPWISVLSGLSLLFFAVSGLTMYIQMVRGRLVRVEQGKAIRGGRFFW